MNKKIFLKKLISFTCILTILVSSINGIAFSASVEYGDELNAIPQKTYSVLFKDVGKDYWAFNYISELVDKRVISGYPDGYFRPDDTISRAEFAKIMVSAAGLTATKVSKSSFADINTNKWYAPFIEIAKSYLTGFRSPEGNSLYYPDKPALREDITVAIVKLKGYDERMPDEAMIQKMFTDYDGISDSAKPFVAIAVESGLISGYSDKTFRAQSTITRAEACALLWRAYQYGNDNKTVPDSDSASTSTTTAAITIVTTEAPTSTLPPQANYKYTVSTLFGGNGQGFINGGKDVSQINNLYDLVVDKNNDIYFIDSDEGNTNLIKKYSNSSKDVNTFLDINTIKWADIGVKQDLQAFIPVSLTYDQYDDRIFASGYLNQSSELSESAITQLKPSVQMVMDNNGFSLVNNFDYDPQFFSANDSAHFFMSDGSFIFGHGFCLKKVSTNGTVSVFSIGHKDEGVSIILDNYIYSLRKSYGELSSYNMATKKESSIWWDNDLDYDSVLAYNGSFYATKNSDIYRIGMDGSKTTIFDINDVAIEDNLPLPMIDKFTFDQNGNIIFYDTNAEAVRRISAKQ